MDRFTEPHRRCSAGIPMNLWSNAAYALGFGQLRLLVGR